LTARQALGKGLGALIPDRAQPEQDRKPSLQTCGIEEIRPNPRQPRKRFDELRIEELAESVRQKGILQPLLVRRQGDGFELIAGERRWRAAQKAGIKEVPIIVRDAPEPEVLELSLIENIQRENLNAIEEGEAYKALIEQFHLTQEEVSQKVGKDRTTVTNTLRLLRLPQEIKDALVDGLISMGHARAFLALEVPDKQRLALRRVLAEGLSVRQTENLIKRLRLKERSAPAKKNDDWRHPLAEELQTLLGTRVNILSKGKKGRIEIEFYSLDELDRIIGFLRK
jgi:ParB family transcriptional regulator, chromosome partitioning protein